MKDERKESLETIRNFLTSSFIPPPSSLLVVVCSGQFLFHPVGDKDDAFDC
jgi:ABC-type bacteriocin/lantibiotic exporter with double-glycine peptidase domain